MNNFYNDLPKPFFALAPMADVTDVAFRYMFTKYGKPDVLYTEFVSADGLFSAGREILERDLDFSPAEYPIVAQFFTSKLENIYKAAKYSKEMGFSGFDINMGCPDRSIEKQMCGASLIKNPKLAVELIDTASKIDIPLSIKTRIGYNKNECADWIGILLETKPKALTIHLRTRKEMSSVPAHWDVLDTIIPLRNKISPETLIIGNGDVTGIEDGIEKSKRYKCDGIMIGRAAFGTPWLFNKDGWKPSNSEKLEIMLEHTRIFSKKLGDIKNFAIMKKHYKAYINGFDGAKELRSKLMEVSTIGEVEHIVAGYIDNV